MDYTNQLIRDIADVANPQSHRKLAIGDSQKSNVALTTLAITAGQMGLDTHIMRGIGEDGEPTRFLIVTPDVSSTISWTVDLQMVGKGYKAGSMPRQRLQRHLGLALGYKRSSIEEFIKSDVASECPCTCCGGDPTGGL
ncbi:MAG: hypothetical protein GY764_11320 [Halieaceae bacterium]|nr:hypothetical protein [Halieaceae bacterium]